MNNSNLCEKISANKTEKNYKLNWKKRKRESTGIDCHPKDSGNEEKWEQRETRINLHFSCQDRWSFSYPRCVSHFEQKPMQIYTRVRVFFSVPYHLSPIPTSMDLFPEWFFSYPNWRRELLPKQNEHNTQKWCWDLTIGVKQKPKNS